MVATYAGATGQLGPTRCLHWDVRAHKRKVAYLLAQRRPPPIPLTKSISALQSMLCFDSAAHPCLSSQVMCRNMLGLCEAQTVRKATSRRQASECDAEVDDVSSRMKRLVAKQQDTLMLARTLAADAGNHKGLQIAMNAFK